MATEDQASGARSHWMVFVKWATIIRWKRDHVRGAVPGEGVYPYQYSSDSVRFLEIEQGDILWVVTTPRFGSRGQPSMSGRARPPAVMARLRVDQLCCHRKHDLERRDDNKATVCLGKLDLCEDPGVLEGGVHHASDAWSIVAIGERDKKKDRDPLQVTYPPLYNFFGVLPRLRFTTKRGETDLSDYLEFVAAQDYLTPAQQEAKRGGRTVRNPGPYAPLGQILQTPRRLTADAARAMDEIHERAVRGNRVFFSYKWQDVEAIARTQRRSRVAWIGELSRRLDDAGYSSWIDHLQLPEGDVDGLLDEVLQDAVRQSVLFVALLSPNYGTGTTLEEWRSSRERAADDKYEHGLVPIVLECGGEPGDLGLAEPDVRTIPLCPTPSDVVEAIEAAHPSRGSGR